MRLSSTPNPPGPIPAEPGTEYRDLLVDGRPTFRFDPVRHVQLDQPAQVEPDTDHPMAGVILAAGAVVARGHLDGTATPALIAAPGPHDMTVVNVPVEWFTCSICDQVTDGPVRTPNGQPVCDDCA